MITDPGVYLAIVDTLDLIDEALRAPNLSPVRREQLKLMRADYEQRREHLRRHLLDAAAIDTVATQPDGYARILLSGYGRLSRFRREPDPVVEALMNTAE